MLSLAGLEKITGINQRQLSHYLNGVKKPRQETIQKIEESIHRFANELSQVNFV
jgi:transcriptional regulator with XRE-family HTH domain